MAQSVKHLSSAQVMISQSVNSPPPLVSVLTAQSLEPASDSVSPSFPAPPHACACVHTHYLSQSKINKLQKISGMQGNLLKMMRGVEQKA